LRDIRFLFDDTKLTRLLGYSVADLCHGVNSPRAPADGG